MQKFLELVQIIMMDMHIVHFTILVLKQQQQSLSMVVVASLTLDFLMIQKIILKHLKLKQFTSALMIKLKQFIKLEQTTAFLILMRQTPKLMAP